MPMISLEQEEMISLVVDSAVASAEALVACPGASSVEVVLEISVILVGVASRSNSPVSHQWVAQALLRPKLKPLLRMVNE
jgi:hypothetical protein